MGHIQRYDFIPEDQTDSQYDYDYTNETDTGFSRGGRIFNRPNGWRKIALKVKGKYEYDDWFGGGKNKRKGEKNSLKGEWPVSYHGPKDHNTIANIIRDGYKQALNTRSQYGRGTYSSPKPEVAEGYAKKFQMNGKNIKAMLMNRVNMSSTNVEWNGKVFVTTNDRMIRPIAVLIKEV